MTLNISVTPVIQSFPFIYVNVFPANNCLLLCGLYSFNCTSETNKVFLSLPIHIIPLSPVLGWDIHIAACYLSVCLPADLSHIRPWPAVQYCMEGESSAGGSSILCSDGREHSAPEGFKDSPAQTRMLPFVKSSLKIKEPFLQLIPIVPKSLQCWDVGTS